MSPRFLRTSALALTAIVMSGSLLGTPILAPPNLGGLDTAAADTIDNQVAWVPNDTVRAIDPNFNYGQVIGGDFTEMSVSANRFAVFNPDDTGLNNVDRTFPPADGDVYVTISDGVGGWFIGGNFQKIGNPTQALPYLAHVNSDGSVDGNFVANVDAPVRALQYLNDKLYIGGDFTSASGEPHQTFAILDPATGAVDSTVAPDITSGSVKAIAVDANGEIYIGGDFAVSGGSTQHLASLTCGNPCTFSNWNPPLNGTVNVIALDGFDVFVGGAFTSADGYQNQRYLARFIRNLGNVLLLDPNFEPSANSVVRAAQYGNDGYLYVGGDFTSLFNGSQAQSVNYLARIDPGTGAADTNWLPDLNGSVRSFTLSTANVFAGGSFTAMGGQARHGVAIINRSTGGVSGVDVSPSGDVNSVAVNDTGSPSRVAIGGSFTNVSATTRNRAAMLDSQGNLTAWNPNVDGSVRSILSLNDKILMSGDFTTVNGGAHSRSYFAAFNTSSGAFDQVFPIRVNGAVNAMVSRAYKVYLGGDFTTVTANGEDYPRSRLAKINGQDWSLESWRADVSGGVVKALGVSSSTVYAGGTFTQTDSGIDVPSGWRYVGAFDYLTGDVRPSWNARADGAVNAIVVGSTMENYSANVYLGGEFTHLMGQARHHAGAIADYDEYTQNSYVAQKLRKWDPQPDRPVLALAMDSRPSGKSIAMAGEFENVGGITRNGFALVAAEARGAVRTMDLAAQDPANEVLTVASSYVNFYAGGKFTPRAALGTRNFAQSMNTETTSLVFEDLNTGYYGSSMHTILVRNRSGYVINQMISASVTGSGFSSLSNGCGSGPLSANMQCTIYVMRTGGTANAVLTLTVGGNTETRFTEVLSEYSGTAGPLTASTTTFGNKLVSDTPTSFVTTLTNTGSAPVIPSAASISGTGISVDYNTCTKGDPIQAGDTCAIKLKWLPTQAGALTDAALSFTYPGASPSEQQISLIGNAIQAGPLTFSDGAFASTTTGQTTTKTITVTNTGGYNAAPSAITVQGAGVTKTGGTCSTSATIAPSATCTVELTWTPTQAGALANASLTVAYPNGVNATDTQTLTGEAINPPVTPSEPNATPQTPSNASNGAPSANAGGSNATPLTPSTTKQPLAGAISKLAGSAAQSAPIRKSPRPAAKSAKSAPTVSIPVGTDVRVSIGKLPKRKIFTASIQVAGKWYVLGTVKSSAAGAIEAPALTSDSAGPFLFKFSGKGQPDRFVIARFQ